MAVGPCFETLYGCTEATTKCQKSARELGTFVLKVHMMMPGLFRAPLLFGLG